MLMKDGVSRPVTGSGWTKQRRTFATSRRNGIEESSTRANWTRRSEASSMSSTITTSRSAIERRSIQTWASFGPCARRMTGMRSATGGVDARRRGVVLLLFEDELLIGLAHGARKMRVVGHDFTVRRQAVDGLH